MSEFLPDEARKKFLRQEYISRINRVLDYIEQHLDQDLSLEILAGVANFSRFHFHRLFRALMGETVVRLESCVRMSRNEVWFKKPH